MGKVKRSILLLVLVGVCTLGAGPEEYFTRYPVLRKVVIRDAVLSGVAAVNLAISDARASASYAAINWHSGQSGAVFIYHFTGKTQNMFPSHAEEWELLSKYDRVPEPCSLRALGIRSVDAFRIVGESESDQLCEPAVNTPDVHAILEMALKKSGWKREQVMHKQIMIVGTYALIEMTQNGWPTHGQFYTQGFVRSGAGWKGATFTDDVCSMSQAKVPWSVASKFIDESAEISSTVEEDELTLHGSHCSSNYDPKLLKL